VIVNDLKSLGEDIKDKDFSHKFLRCLPARFAIIKTLLAREDLSTKKPNQILGEIITQDMNNEEVLEEKKKKSVALKATPSKSKGKVKMFELEEKSTSSDDEDDEAMALLVRKFGRFMKRKGYGQGKKKFISKNKQEPRRCFKCKSLDHFIIDCPLSSENDNESDDDKKKSKKKDKKEKKNKNVTLKKKKKGQSYCVTWDDSDASTDDDNSDDESKTIKKKAMASIALNNKLSLFDTPSTCLMAKPSKVQSNDESDEEEISCDELMSMLDDANTYIEAKRKECKELCKGKLAIEQSFDELLKSHERLMEAHENLKVAHSKLEKAHSSLVAENEKRASIKTCDMGSSCDILSDMSIPSSTIVVTNPSCSSTTPISPKVDDFKSSLVVENKNLKEGVNKLTRALGNAYGGDACLLKCLGSQRFSHSKKRLGYTPKKGKAAFVTHKASFVRSNGRYCQRCKQVGHNEQYCMANKIKQVKFASATSIRLDSCYMLIKGVKGVKAKYIGTPRGNPRMRSIWVPKSLVTNLQGPKNAWVPKTN
jgi:hypothetical protein